MNTINQKSKKLIFQKIQSDTKKLTTDSCLAIPNCPEIHQTVLEILFGVGQCY